MIKMKVPRFIRNICSRSSNTSSLTPSNSQSSRGTCKTAAVENDVDEDVDVDESPAAAASELANDSHCPHSCPGHDDFEDRSDSGAVSKPRFVPPMLANETDHSSVSTPSECRPSTSSRSERRHSSVSSRGLSTSFTGNLTTSGQCPYRHGTVYSNPYPGYVHGNPKRGICPNGCRPEMNAYVTDSENQLETLTREAMEYIQLYYHERQDEMKGTDGFLSKKERMNEIKQSIEATGTYEHTFDELQHGARVAWRNAPKCSNRKYWQQLKLLDQRKVATNKEMFDCCIKHLSKAVSTLSISNNTHTQNVILYCFLPHSVMCWNL